jgi:hypothetical protein
MLKANNLFQAKNLFFIIFFLLLLIPSASAVTVSDCNSGSGSWKCETGKSCVCSITGPCTNGVLQVYRSIGDVLCIFEVPSGLSVSINWNNCGSPSGTIKVKADCDEGQSPEKTITLSAAPVTTTTTTPELFPPGCRKEGHVCTSKSLCCSGLQCVDWNCKPIPTSSTTSTTKPTTATPTTTTTAIVKKQCPHECCKAETFYYDKNCAKNYICIENICVEAETNYTVYYIIIGLLIAVVVIALIVYFFFKKKQPAGKEPEGSGWKTLEEKWSRK